MNGVAIVIMGVTGSGKSTVGRCLAKALLCDFIDADDYHSPANKEKMHNGIPLSDEDRLPWLQAVVGAMKTYMSEGKTIVVACSSLQRKYRDVLRSADPEQKLTPTNDTQENSTSNTHSEDPPRRLVVFVCLQGSAELISSRLEQRATEGTHFMSPSLLQSQLDLLEIDDSEGVLIEDITEEPNKIAENIIRKLFEMKLLSS
eukprot:TRINITY_DN37877_c0_g1_i1.p1 TRINITY_DN37877_c0_g1~~TRINITY_DN37877_c0_g1_i1.p1  ORF type:complete len:202 (-),score=42.09 TRINITY_DN37877_c0_g1_i1:295-900(-)